MKNAVVFQRAALIWKIYHCPWEKGSRRLISRKENVFFIKKKFTARILYRKGMDVTETKNSLI